MKTVMLVSRTLEVEVVLPSRQSSGARFCGGAWIRAVRCLKTGRDYFITDPMRPHSLAFGCPHEFRTPLNLGDSGGAEVEQMKIGVGRILHENKISRFSDRLLEIYPWHTEKRECSGFESLSFTQQVEPENGYAYTLKQDVCARDGVVRIASCLTNTGSRRIETDVYLHPFLDERPSARGIWVSIPEWNPGEAKESHLWNSQVPLEDFPPDNTLFQPEEGHVINRVTTGDHSSEGRLDFRSEDPFSKINIWRLPGLCYAIEPYLPICVEPRDSKRWNWWILAGNGVGGENLNPLNNDFI